MNLLTVDEVCHYDRDGDCVWSCENLKNILHTQGEEYMLKSLFVKSAGVSIPSSYYVGLDNRPTTNQADILSSIVGEPSGHGYARFVVNSQNGFSAIFDTINWKIKSSTILFNAIGGSWGPVRNAFLTTGSGNQGYLISTVTLPSTRTLNSGESFSFRITLGVT